MKRKLVIGFLAVILLQQYIMGQSESYTIKKASFSSVNFDEFSPVYYNNGIVFCTNRNPNLFLNYSSSQNKRQFKIYYIDTTGNRKSRNARLLSKNLTTKFNDGPVTFSPSGDTIYYCRNLKVDGKLREISGAQNKLGLFTAVLEGKKWTKIREFRFNNEWYNISTPWLSPDGTKLYFASDKPGGYGGSDLYYCQWKKDFWANPVNLGPNINTSGNEAYPFIAPSGDLFFSSDGHTGLGKKDIFISRYVDSVWLNPVNLGSGINSTSDDFGFICDSMMNEGYFSSNRNNTLDIYRFKTNYHQAFYCDSQRINNYCFKLTDKSSIIIDENLFQYEWKLGNGTKIKGKDVEYCFPGPGKYNVTLNLIDKSLNTVFFTKLVYEIDLKDIEQPYIVSASSGIVGDDLMFDGQMSYLPGYKIIEYSWDFGDGNHVVGVSVNHSYKVEGRYSPKLNLTVQNETTRIISESCITKGITIYKIGQAQTDSIQNIDKLNTVPDLLNYDHAYIKTLHSDDSEISQGAVYQVEVLSSKDRIGVENEVFKNLLSKYYIREEATPDSGLFSYIVDEAKTLDAVYPTFKNIFELGFKDARIRTHMVSDPAERELMSIKNVYGTSVDNFFARNDIKLSADGYAFLDQIAAFLNKYSDAKLLIELHSDEIGTLAYNLELSQRRVQAMNYYLITKNIDIQRITTRGYGKTRPLVLSNTEVNRRINRRVDFSLINISNTIK